MFNPITNCFACKTCGRRHYVPRTVGSAITQRMCSCGGMLAPILAGQGICFLHESAPVTPTRRCQACGAHLRLGNEGMLCACCERSVSAECKYA